MLNCRVRPLNFWRLLVHIYWCFRALLFGCYRVRFGWARSLIVLTIWTPIELYVIRRRMDLADIATILIDQRFLFFLFQKGVLILFLLRYDVFKSFDFSFEFLDVDWVALFLFFIDRFFLIILLRLLWGLRFLVKRVSFWHVWFLNGWCEWV